MIDAVVAGTVQRDAPAIRQIGWPDLKSALADGYADFMAIPTQLVFLCLIYPIVGFAAARAADGDFLPMLFPLTAGLSLMGPLLAVGTYEISRRREAGLPVSWLSAFSVFRSPAIVSLVMMGFLLLAVFFIWLGCARAIYAATIGSGAPDSIGSLIAMALQTSGGRQLILWGNLAGLLFAIVVLSISVVSIPMLLDRQCSPFVAIQTSMRAVARNPATMAVWGLIVAALLAAGSIPFFVGLAVVMPVLGHATWHLYKRVVA